MDGLIGPEVQLYGRDGIISFVDPSGKIIRFHLKLKITAAFPDLVPKIVS